MPLAPAPCDSLHCNSDTNWYPPPIMHQWRPLVYPLTFQSSLLSSSRVPTRVHVILHTTSTIPAYQVLRSIWYWCAIQVVILLYTAVYCCIPWCCCVRMSCYSQLVLLMMFMLKLMFWHCWCWSEERSFSSLTSKLFFCRVLKPQKLPEQNRR